MYLEPKIKPHLQNHGKLIEIDVTAVGTNLSSNYVPKRYEHHQRARGILEIPFRLGNRFQQPRLRSKNMFSETIR